MSQQRGTETDIVLGYKDVSHCYEIKVKKNYVEELVSGWILSEKSRGRDRQLMDEALFTN